ncbi:MAG: hypothetical protein WCP08_01510 [Prolixibacteraceae bacterium]
MKKKIGLIFFLFFGLTTIAQIKPETFVIEMPVVTTSVCKKEIREQFLQKVDKLKGRLDEEISRRKDETKKNTKGMDEQAAKNMMSQMGVSVSDADIQKMKTATKEEKKAMADKMMQQTMNMSVDEAQKVSKMSKAGKQAWAEGMTTEMMADAQANPDKYKAAQKSSMGMYEMAQEQSQLAQKIQTGLQKFSEQLEEFDKLKVKAKLEFEACEKKVDKEFENKVNHVLGDEYYETIKLQKEACYQAYCGFLIPKYKTLLLDRFNAIVATGDDYNRMDVLANQLTSATTGSKKVVYEPGLMYLEALKDYMRYLENLP